MGDELRRVLACLSLTTTIIGIAGCGGNDDTTTPTIPTTASHESTPSPTQTRSAAPTTVQQSPGTEVATDWGSVTYFGQQRPAAPDAPPPDPPGTEWVAIDVQTCLDSDQQGGNLDNIAWTVTDTGNGRTEPSDTTYSHFPVPEYPIVGYIDSGTCVRGWIVYPILIGRELTGIRYFPSSAAAPLASWTA